MAEHLACAATFALAVGCGVDAGSGTLSSTTGDPGTSSGPPMAMTLGTLPTSPASSSGATSSGAEATTDDGSSTDAQEDSSTGAAEATATTSSTTSSTTGVAPGLGEITGPCGVLSPRDFDAAASQFIVNAIDFGDTGFDYDALTPGGQEVHDEGNLGGSSLLSEVMSFDVLARCEGVSLLKTESEIIYDDDGGPKTDLLIDSGGVQVGVSVTRAVAFPFDDPYPAEAATVLLEDKLAGVLASTDNVSPADAWPKQILHILAYAPMHADVLEAAYADVDPALQADTIVWVTVTDGDDLFIYD